MATQEKREERTGLPGSQKPAPTQEPNRNQEPKGDRPADQEAAREKEREAYRHGGIPLGSDPRE